MHKFCVCVCGRTLTGKRKKNFVKGIIFIIQTKNLFHFIIFVTHTHNGHGFKICMVKEHFLHPILDFG